METGHCVEPEVGGTWTQIELAVPECSRKLFRRSGTVVVWKRWQKQQHQRRHQNNAYWATKIHQPVWHILWKNDAFWQPAAVSFGLSWLKESILSIFLEGIVGIWRHRRAGSVPQNSFLDFRTRQCHGINLRKRWNQPPRCRRAPMMRTCLGFCTLFSPSVWRGAKDLRASSSRQTVGELSPSPPLPPFSNPLLPPPLLFFCSASPPPAKAVSSDKSLSRCSSPPLSLFISRLSRPPLHFLLLLSPRFCAPSPRFLLSPSRPRDCSVD